LFFTHWYISRYSKLFSPIPFPGMIALIIGLSGAVMIYGWLRDRKQHRLPENNQ
jgi:hypothetical protein